MDIHAEGWCKQMRRDWDKRAERDAENYIYTRRSADELDFAASGKANYDQLVRPYLPVLLDSRRACDCDMLEIGCGIGRMTEWFARSFRRVYAIDVSEVMLRKAEERLKYANLEFHLTDGANLCSIASDSLDFVFSY